MNKLNSITTLLCTTLLLSVFTFTSCGGSDSPISKSDVQDAVEEMPILDDSTCFVSVRFGYYEVQSGEEYARLKKLSKAKLIKLTCKPVEHSYMQYDENGEANYGVGVSAVFVEVSLADLGQKYLISKKPLNLNKLHKKMYEKYNTEPTGKSLKDSLRYLNIKLSEDDLSDNFFLSRGFSVDSEEKETDEIDEEEIPDRTGEVYKSTMYKDDNIDYLDPYSQALKQEHFETKYFLLYKYQVAEVYDVYQPKELLEAGQAKAKVLLSLTDITPFGYIFLDEKGILDRKYVSLDLNLKYYQDQEWIVDTYEMRTPEDQSGTKEIYI